MQLRDFVRESIVQICEGIAAADVVVRDRGGAVNPPSEFGLGDAKGLRVHADQGYLSGMAPIDEIHFDVAVTAAEGTQTSGGIAVVTGFLGLGSKGESSESETVVSRIQFSVPIQYPCGLQNE